MTLFRIKFVLRYKYKLDINTTPSKFTTINLIISTGSYPDIPQNIPNVYIFPQITELDAKNINEACDKIYEEKFLTSI